MIIATNNRAAVRTMGALVGLNPIYAGVLPL
jgi:hypothetical protein